MDWSKLPPPLSTVLMNPANCDFSGDSGDDINTWLQSICPEALEDAKQVCCVVGCPVCMCVCVCVCVCVVL